MGLTAALLVVTARQQDCMELLRHLLTENCLPRLQCCWEARPLPGSVAARRPMIRGLISIDLQLPRRTHDTTLQECIICWHEQKIPHGLLCAPEFLLVTLARYASVARGKNRTRVPCKAMQPASQCSLAQTPYSLVAAVLHLGSTPQQGHYRTFMANSRTAPCATMQELTAFSTEPSHNSAGGRGYSAPTGRPSAPSGSPSYTWWCTEDGKPAEVCHPTYSRILSENCYILCFRLDTQPRTVLE